MMLDLKAPRQLSNGLIHAGALTIVLILSLESSISRSSEAKEFDWNDLGVSLGAPKTSNFSAANLRILVSPQRRSSKNYEFEYTNGSQPTSASQSDPSAYVVSSGGSPYLAQSLYQLSPNHSTGHSSAYSALSASLASLKSRLNARGVTLTSTLADSSGQAPSHIYASTNNAYGSSVIIDPSQHSSASQQQQQTQAQQSSQPAYLSVSGQQQDSQASSPYTVPPSQGNENKTIVLAIPAKINFLTGSKSPSSQQQQQQQQQHQHQQQLHQQSVSQPAQQVQQLSVLQSTGMLNAPDGSIEQVGQMAPVEQQEHQQQYLIVNQPQGFSDHHSHSVAANLSPTPVAGPSGQVYSTIYHSAQGLPQASGYAMKYLPAFSQASAGQLQQPAVQKVYSVIESPQMPAIQQQQSLPAQMTIAQQAAPMMQASYEPQMEQMSVQQPAPISGTRYISCIDTCNSADPRWRKYTVSRYRACCSRSSQYDASYEQPSAEKVGESSARYSDDAYYSYLQSKRSRSKRARRQRARQYSGGYGSASASSAPASTGSYQEDDGVDSGSFADGSVRSGQHSSYQEPAPTKYYKSRGYGSSSSSSSSDLGAGEPPARHEAPPTASKYSSKGRAGRRGRSRAFEAPVESAQPLDDPVEDGSVYPREPNTRSGSPPASYSPSLTFSSGYGSGDHSVDLQGRGYGTDARSNGDEEDSTRYDDSAEMEPSSGGQDYSSDASADSGDEPEQDPATSGAAYKYPSNSSASTYRKKMRSSRRRPAVVKEQPRPYNSYKKSSGRKTKSKYDNGQLSSSNATDYESAQPGDHYQDSANGPSQDQEDHSSVPSYPLKETTSSYESSESEKESNTGSKYRPNLNDTAVANLSKTTLHLKEILSILEKKAYAKGNESLFSEQSQKQQQGQLVTSTSLPPVTTTTSSYPFSLLGSPYSSSLSGDFLSPDFGTMKSPYKFDHTSFSSGSLGSPSLSLPSFGSFGSETMTPLSQPYPSPYALHTGGKHMNNPNGSNQRKRRVNKNARYNDLMLQKAAQSLASPPSLLHAKNRFLSPSYYSALQYPYLYRGASQALGNPYPYKNHHKNPYSSLLSGSMSSKLAAAAANSGNMYTDESRLHGLTGLDPLANMASSLRPSAAMRLRSKPFIFQPQVLPIYTRHSILAQPLDGKA